MVRMKGRFEILHFSMFRNKTEISQVIDERNLIPLESIAVSRSLFAVAMSEFLVTWCPTSTIPSKRDQDDS